MKSPFECFVVAFNFELERRKAYCLRSLEMPCLGRRSFDLSRSEKKREVESAGVLFSKRQVRFSKNVEVFGASKPLTTGGDQVQQAYTQ